MTSTTEQSVAGDYTLDVAHTRIGFAARHAMVSKVRGEFGEFAGTAHLDEDPALCSATLTIDAASIRTGLDLRDDNLRGSGFLDVENHPTITFDSTGVEPRDGGGFRVTGDLTIRGVTRPVTVDFERTGAAVDPWGNFRVGFEGRAVINRKDWGVSWNAALETGGVLVGDQVTLELDVAAYRPV